MKNSVKLFVGLIILACTCNGACANYGPAPNSSYGPTAAAYAGRGTIPPTQNTSLGNRDYNNASGTNHYTKASGTKYYSKAAGSGVHLANTGAIYTPAAGKGMYANASGTKMYSSAAGSAGLHLR